MLRWIEILLPFFSGLAGSVWILRRRARIKRELLARPDRKQIAAMIQRLSDYCRSGAPAAEEAGDFEILANGEECQGCGSLIYGRAFRLPHLPGYHCSVECLKVHLASLDIPAEQAAS